MNARQLNKESNIPKEIYDSISSLEKTSSNLSKIHSVPNIESKYLYLSSEKRA